MHREPVVGMDSPFDELLSDADILEHGLYSHGLDPRRSFAPAAS